MGTLKGNFIGFTVNGFHSSDLGIIRTSNGDRFEKNLLPLFQDQTTQVSGVDGVYYWKTNRQSRDFSIPIAFDSLTEEHLQNLIKAVPMGQIFPLVFDELPYKEYLVKLKSSPQLNYICFGDDGTRVYKGEGVLEFICYSGIGRNRYINNVPFKFLDQYTEDTIPEWENFISNKDEWAAASGLLQTQGDYDKDISVDKDGNLKIGHSIYKIYNAGDIDTPLMTYFSFEYGSIFPSNLFLSEVKDQSGGIKVFNNSILTFSENEIIPKGEDTGFRINFKTNLIEGYIEKNGEKILSGNLYNEIIVGGEWFKIPTQKTLFLHSFSTNSNLPFQIKSLEYNYLYY